MLPPSTRSPSWCAANAAEAGALHRHDRAPATKRRQTQNRLGEARDRRSSHAAARDRRPPIPGGKAAKTAAKTPVLPASGTGMRLHTADGARKYLTAAERDAFLAQADIADRQVRRMCITLASAGCRLSEALALTIDRVDLAAGVPVIESLKNGAPEFSSEACCGST